MELLLNLILGFEVALTPVNLTYAFVGVVCGTLIGVLPGIGPLVTIALLMPFTFGLPSISAMIMLAGIYYGAQYGASTTAILINIPGEASSVVTCLDGHELARQGRAGPALAVAALGSLFAGTIGTLVIGLFGAPLSHMALMFGSPEYCSLMVLGLVAAVVLARGSLAKAFGMIFLGLLLGVVGSDPHSGVYRFTFGLNALEDGLSIIIIAMGVFGFAEIINALSSYRERQLFTSSVGRLIPTREDVRASWKPVIRGTALGTFFGILPGAGPTIASFSSYALEKRISKDPSRFGYGAIEGVAGPESANNAAAQTAFIPTLTLGIPGNATMALFLSAMILHGITPGPSVISAQPNLFWGLIASMWIGNLMLVLLNLPLIGIWVRLLTIPYRWLYPGIVLFMCIGTYSMGFNPEEVALTALFGVVGVVFYRLGMEPAPLLLGAVLGPMFEENLRRSLLLSRGDPTIFLTKPISLAFLVLAAILLISVVRPTIRMKREKVFAGAED